MMAPVHVSCWPPVVYARQAPHGRGTSANNIVQNKTLKPTTYQVDALTMAMCFEYKLICNLDAAGVISPNGAMSEPSWQT